MPDFMELLAGGIDSSMGNVLEKVKAVAGTVKEMLPDFSGFSLPELALAGEGNVGSTTTTTNNKTTNLGGISVTVNGYNARNDNELAQMIASKINDMLDEDNSVFK